MGTAMDSIEINRRGINGDCIICARNVGISLPFANPA
jgi:hypothetical protein